MDKREELAAWAKSLKPGDKVIYIRKGYPEDNLSILEISRVTPTGWIKTTNGNTFSLNKWFDGIVIRGKGYGEIIPVTDELLKKTKKQEAERAENERKIGTIVKARQILRNALEKYRDMTYDQAVKIIEAFENMEPKK